MTSMNSFSPLKFRYKANKISSLQDFVLDFYVNVNDLADMPGAAWLHYHIALASCTWTNLSH
jgi:hypothetical protein